MRIVWSRRAVFEHDALVEHVSRDSPRAANEQGERVVAAIEALADAPDRGRLGRVPGTRELVVPRTPYVVVYRRTRGDRIDILRILHGAQRWPPA